MEREMNTKILGVSFEGRQENVKGLVSGQVLWPLHETDNPFDPNAIKLFADEALTLPLGYIGKELARDISAQSRLGWSYAYRVSAITGGGTRTMGVNIVITASRPG